MMKKILLLSAFLGLTLHTAVTAQTFEAQMGDTSILGWANGSTFKIYNRLRSTSSTPVTLRWRVLNPASAVPSGWTLTGVCDNLGCRSAATTLDNTWKESGMYDNSNFSPLTNDFHIQYDDMTTAPNATSVFQIQVQDVANNSSQKTLTFIASKGTAGVVKITRSEDEVVLYPNPARGAINVLFSADAGVKNIALYNLIGKPVMVYRVQGASSAKLELETVPSGVYFIRLLDAQGHVVATRRFTHQ